MDFTARQVGKFVETGDGLKIHFHERGSGQPVVLLHGREQRRIPGAQIVTIAGTGHLSDMERPESLQ